jgi:carboxymethylenebutenolidase
MRRVIKKSPHDRPRSLGYARNLSGQHRPGCALGVFGVLPLPRYTGGCGAWVSQPPSPGSPWLFKDVCERLAAEGFVAFAPDRYGGPTAATIEEAEALQREREDWVRTEALLGPRRSSWVPMRPWSERGLEPWASQPGPLGHYCSRCASPILLGPLSPSTARRGRSTTPGARAAYLGHYAEVDKWEPIDEVQGKREALREAGCEVGFYTYPGVGHWFFEEDCVGRYDAQAASLAWERTIGFLRTRLGQN